jgi:hypothetical protein
MLKKSELYFLRTAIRRGPEVKRGALILIRDIWVIVMLGFLILAFCICHKQNPLMAIPPKRKVPAVPIMLLPFPLANH